MEYEALVKLFVDLIKKDEINKKDVPDFLVLKVEEKLKEKH